MTKEELRIYMRTKRRNLAKDYIKNSSKSITEKVCPILKNSSTVMVYLSAFNEPDTTDIIKYLEYNKIKTVVPMSNTDTHTMSLSYISDLDELQRGAYKILEPMSPVEANPNDIDVVLVPGIAFSKTGDRLGFGKGYYDKFLADFTGSKIGICYDFQVLDDIPSFPHDIKMDAIITEKRIYNDF